MPDNVSYEELLRVDEAIVPTENPIVLEMVEVRWAAVLAFLRDVWCFMFPAVVLSSVLSISLAGDSVSPFGFFCFSSPQTSLLLEWWNSLVSKVTMRRSGRNLC